MEKGIIIVTGLILVYLGVQLLFKTEITLEKMIKRSNLSKNSVSYKFITNKSNLIFYKITGVMCIVYGAVCFLFLIIKHMKQP
jgi:hypothetical protein